MSLRDTARAMSQENVEMVKGFLAAGAEMDKQTLLAALPEVIAQTCDPEIEWHEDPQRADARVYRGHDGVRESVERWLDQWDEYGTEAERFVDCGDAALVPADLVRSHAAIREMLTGLALRTSHARTASA